MNVLTVFAHPGVRSFCHAVLERFDAGLRDAGHTNEIVDLYAIGFDPILRPRDTPSWLTETIPDDMLDRMRLRETLLEEAGGPLKRLALKRCISATPAPLTNAGMTEWVWAPAWKRGSTTRWRSVGPLRVARAMHSPAYR